MKRILLLLIVLLLVGADAVWAQTRKVTGTVLDEKNQGLPGAGILIKGTQSGTATDVDGKFQLDVPDGSNTLVVQAIGYARKEVTITGNSLIIRMQPESKTLNETVVTALGIKKEKKSLGYSVSEVSSDAIDKSGEQNIIEALAAKAPGANITSSGGTPGASTKILLRGNSTFTGNNQPLVVIDGIPVDNSTNDFAAGDYPFLSTLEGVNESNRALDINPNDVESVSVLRGPAAAALYGSRGGNGAIIITTKKGKYGKGKSLGVTYSSSLEISKVSRLPDLQGVYLQGNGGQFSTGTANSWGPRADTSGMPTYNKYKDFFQTGLSYINNVAIDGGNENSIFRLSVGNTTTSGVIPTSKLKRTTVTLSAESKLSDWLTVGGSANYTNTQATRIQNGSNLSGVMLPLLRAPLNYNVKNYKDANGNPITYYGPYDSPLWTVNENPYTDQTNRVFGNVYANAKLSKSFSINWKTGTDAYTTDAQQIWGIGSNPGNSHPYPYGQVDRISYDYRQIYSDFILRYNKYLSERVELNAFVGYNFLYEESNSIYSRGRNTTAPGVPGFWNYSNFNEYYASNTESYQRSQGVYGEATLGYNSFLYLTVTGRNDWTTAFGRNGRSLFYPKADLAWIFSEHINRNNVLTYGKLRFAYSDAGVAPSPYSYTKITYYAAPFINDGYAGNGFPYLGNNGSAPLNVNYPGGLVPADVEGREVGLETRWLKNRVNLEIVLYNQISHNNLIQRPVAPSSGYQAEYTNAGEIQNKGIELTLGVDILKSKNFQWNVSGSFSKNKSKVLSIVDGVNQINYENGFSQIASEAIVGQPYGVFYGTAWERDASGKLLIDESTGLPDVTTTSKIIGDPNPKYLLNISNSFTYKGLNFSFVWDIRHGGDIWNGTWQNLNYRGLAGPTADRTQTYLINGVYDANSPHAGQANTVQVSALDYFTYYKGALGATENAVYDGSWVRLRSVNLSYRFNLRAKNPNSTFNFLELGVTGRNLLLFTNYPGVDPETSLTGAASNITGYDYFNNPGTKSVLFNVRVGL
ncbi:SusC/RagA family TonB-linked outer membrane protein [Chitinophagaceae bacterium MMS25-I14]